MTGRRAGPADAEPASGGGRSGRPLRLVEYGVVPEPQLPALWEVYLKSFGGLATRAASRHLMSAEQFHREMTDPAITKFVVHAGGLPVGLLTITADLDGIIWVSPEYYRNRYPDKARRGKVFYVTNMLTDPDHHGRDVFNLLTEAACRAASGGVLGFDICRSNVERGFAEAIRRRANALHAGASLFEALDTQTFYGIDLTGPLVPDCSPDFSPD
jgi:hypothetical protein